MRLCFHTAGRNGISKVNVSLSLFPYKVIQIHNTLSTRLIKIKIVIKNIEKNEKHLLEVIKHFMSCKSNPTWKSKFQRRTENDR